jgi:restriction system protein
MPIPDFQSIMLPLLKLCSDGQEHTSREMVDALACEYGLTPEELKQMLPSAQQCVFDNRVAWAKAHMKMAALLENVRRGVFRITDRGMVVLGESPKAINLAFLRKFPEYRSVREPHQNNPITEDATSKELDNKDAC